MALLSHLSYSVGGKLRLHGSGNKHRLHPKYIIMSTRKSHLIRAAAYNEHETRGQVRTRACHYRPMSGA